MPTLNFDIDWLDGEGVRGPELAATWAALCIRFGDSVITRVLDARAKTIREFLHLPLYPLAEWLATNWWFLSHEFENPDKKTAADFRHRHNLATGRDGYAFPNLEVISCGTFTRLAWKREVLPWNNVTFLEQGENWIDSNEFRASCVGLIDAVIRRLDALDIRETFLQQEWLAIQAADEEEAEFCGTAAGLGWDPYAVDDGRRGFVLLLAEKLGDVLAEAVPAMGSPNDYEDWRDIGFTIAEARKFNRLPLRRLRSFARDFMQDTEARPYPWDAGYEMARRLRRFLDVGSDPLRDMAELAQALGENAESIDRVSKNNVALGWPSLVDAVVAQDDEGPAFAFRRPGKHEDGRRFHFCRALAEVLMSPGSDTLLTKAHSERQKRNRAFAAEFLAPSQGLKQRVNRHVVDSDDMNEMAADFRVSSLLIEHQIRNHRIADIWDG